MDPSLLGRKLQELRKARGLTQDELSDKAGLAYSTLAKIERGAIKAPSVFTIMSLTQALGVSIEELVAAKRPVVGGDDRPGSIKFVFCDVNGVLVHFFQRAFVALAEDSGERPERIENYFWHYNDAANRGDMSMDEFNQAMANAVGLPEVDWLRYYLAAIQPIKPMQDCLRRLAEHYKVGLLSNNFPGFIDVLIEREVIPELDYSVIVDSHIAHSLKPEPTIYELAQSKVGVSPEEVFFIDDSRPNIMTAEKFGWQVLWFDAYQVESSVKRIEEALL